MRSSRLDGRRLDDTWITRARGRRNAVRPTRPYAYMVEPERTAEGRVEEVATIFLTNRECPFRCLMCDLWKNTTTETTPVGAIAQQIEWALDRLPPARHIKLYNAGSFFDRRAVPREDWDSIADLVVGFDTVIVESHPALVDRAAEWANMLDPRLEVAMGLETVDPEVLPRLNKRMTLADFESAVGTLLTQVDASVRAFILLRAPFQTEPQGTHWAKRSIEFAFDIGVTCCVVIPTRAGNGAMELLQARGDFEPPTLSNLEDVLQHGIRLGGGRVFADLWDIERFYPCPECGPVRADRLRRMNLSQQVLPRIDCGCDAGQWPPPSGACASNAS